MTTASRVSLDHLPLPAPGLRLAMTYAEYLAWAPETMLAEWTAGEVSVAMPAKDRHQRVVALLSALMTFFVGARKLGRVSLAPFEVRLEPAGPSREPDLFFVTTGRLEGLTDDRFYGGSDLVVEVISDDSVQRDCVDKLEEYRLAGVSEYWIIYPRPRHHRTAVYTLNEQGSYQRLGPDDEHGIVQSRILPGFWIDLAWLWRQEANPVELFTRITAAADGAAGTGAQDL